MKKQILKVQVKSEYDIDPDISHYTDHLRIDKSMTEAQKEKIINEDNRRLEMLQEGQLSILHIWVEAEIKVGDNIQQITAGGMGGVEDDNLDNSLDYYLPDMLNELREQLTELGFSKRAINKAIENREMEE